MTCASWTIRSKDRIGIVVSSFRPLLYPWLNVHDNVASGPRMRGLPTKEMERAVDRALELVSLGDFGGHKPYDLSGGMRQRGQGLLKL